MSFYLTSTHEIVSLIITVIIFESAFSRSSTACPSGYYCNAQVSTTTPLNCPQGYYCPQGTALNMIPCPVGTFGSRLNLQSVGGCAMCTAGSYCSATGLTYPSGNCTAGFYCASGSESRFGQTAFVSNQTCPIGSYCPTGSSVPSACPPGTYNPSRGKRAITECLDCPPGSYCGTFIQSWQIRVAPPQSRVAL